MTSARRGGQLLVVLAMLLAALTGCTEAGTTGKGGGPRHGSAVFGYYDVEPNPDGFTPGGPAFLDALRDLSGGRLSPVARNYRDGGPQGLLDAVRTGSIKGAWLQASDLEAGGFSHLAALSVPFEVTTYAQAIEVSRPEVAREFLRWVDGQGVTGLALFPGAMRRPAGRTIALLGPDSWSGQPAWASSPTQRATFTALGARLLGDPLDSQVADLPYLVREDGALFWPHITSNVVLWPRWWVLVANSEWLASLSETERSWVDHAAGTARTAAVSTQPPETELAVQLCKAGARFATASVDQLAELREAVQPVVENVEADPEDAGLLDLLRASVDRADPGPDPSEIAVPRSCKGRVSPVEEVATYPRTRPGIPPGTYRAHLSAEDIAAAGSEKTRDAQVVTLVISADGSYQSSSSFDDDGSSMIFEAGELYGDGHTAYFVNSLARLEALQAAGEDACVWTQSSLGCITNVEPYSVTWSLGGDGSLRFSEPRGMIPDPVTVLSMVANDYQRVS